MIDAKTVADLRKQTGSGIVDCKKALEETSGNFDEAIDLLRKKGASIAAKRQDREAKEGVVATYIHANGKLGAILTLVCETDFVARNDDFKALASDIAMHVAAEAPLYLSIEDVPEEVVAKEKEMFKEQMKEEGKSEEVMDKIIEGKIQKYYSEVCLLKQPFIKDDSVTIEQLIQDNLAKIGEKIEIKDFARLTV